MGVPIAFAFTMHIAKHYWGDQTSTLVIHIFYHSRCVFFIYKPQPKMYLYERSTLQLRFYCHFYHRVSLQNYMYTISYCPQFMHKIFIYLKPNFGLFYIPLLAMTIDSYAGTWGLLSRMEPSCAHVPKVLDSPPTIAPLYIPHVMKLFNIQISFRGSPKYNSEDA